jgi:hypothetical protein
MNLETQFQRMALAKKKFVRRQLVLACHGTHQVLPWHTPRQAMAPTKAHKQTLDLKLGTPSKCLIMNL